MRRWLNDEQRHLNFGGPGGDHELRGTCRNAGVACSELTRKAPTSDSVSTIFVGQRFTSRTHVIDAAQIKAFANQFDPQPFHLDEDTAKDTLFAGLVASGWHTA